MMKLLGNILLLVITIGFWSGVAHLVRMIWHAFHGGAR